MRTFLMFFLLLIYGACDAQVKSGTYPASAKLKATQRGLSKLVRSQGTGQYMNVHCALSDRFGNLWFGTAGEGIYRYDGKTFTQYTEKDGVSSNFIWSVMEDKQGNIWFGTADGACRFDGYGFTNFSPMRIRGDFFLNNTPLNKTKIDRYGHPYPEENSVWTIFQDNSGLLWFGTCQGIYRYNGSTFSHFAVDDGIINNTGVAITGKGYGGIESIMQQHNSGDIWFGGRGTDGVFRFDGKTLKNLKPDGDRWMRPLLEEKNGTIWLANWTSAFRYENGSFVKAGKENPGCVSNITCAFQDSKGNIWFGSDGPVGGVCRYNASGVTHLSTKEGLVNDDVWCIVEDKDGNMWFGTRDMGLCKWDGKKFTTFSESLSSTR